MDRADLVAKDVFRSDRGELRPGRVTKEGFLKVDAFIGRPGIYIYRLQDGTTRRELITAEVLHSRASLDTLKLKPLTNGHPDPVLHPNMVTPENFKELSTGAAGEEIEIADDGRPRFSIIVTDAHAIADVNAGKHFLSPGYTVDLILEPGIHPEFGKYDAKQSNRRYNHLALTDSPRGGDSIHLRLDGAAVRTDDHTPGHEKDPEGKMDLIDELMKKNPSLTREEAKRLIDGGHEALQKADAYDALPEKAREDGLDFEAIWTKAGKFDTLPLPEVVKAEQTADRTERVKLDTMAAGLELKAENTVKLDNDELKAAILIAAKVEVPKIDGLDKATSTKYAWATFEAGYKAPEDAPRIDEDVDTKAFQFDPNPSKLTGGVSNVLGRYDSRNVKAKA